MFMCSPLRIFLHSFTAGVLQGPAAAGRGQYQGDGDPGTFTSTGTKVPQDTGHTDRTAPARGSDQGDGTGGGAAAEEGGCCSWGGEEAEQWGAWCLDLVPPPGGFHSCTPAHVHSAGWAGVRGPDLRAHDVLPTQVQYLP